MPISCSECGASYDRLEVREDQDTVVGYAGTQPIYAKQYICKECTHSWTEESGEQ